MVLGDLGTASPRRRGDLRRVYETVWAVTLGPANFRMRRDHSWGISFVGGVVRGADDAERRTTGALSLPQSRVSSVGIVW